MADSNNGRGSLWNLQCRIALTVFDLTAGIACEGGE
jgi:hypothetical protein